MTRVMTRVMPRFKAAEHYIGLPVPLENNDYFAFAKMARYMQSVNTKPFILDGKEIYWGKHEKRTTYSIPFVSI